MQNTIKLVGENIRESRIVSGTPKQNTLSIKFLLSPLELTLKHKKVPIIKTPMTSMVNKVTLEGKAIDRKDILEVNK